MNDAVSAVAFTLVLVGSVLAPGVLAAPVDGEVQAQERPSETTVQSEQLPDQQTTPADGGLDYEEVGERLQTLAGVDADANATLSDERRAAAARGARTGAQLVQQQGVNVSQSQRQAAIGTSVRAAAQVQNASVEQIQAAARGATRGALLQSQRANVSQLQFAAVGAAAGAAHAEPENQTQRVVVTQIQEAAQGGAYGSLVQRQNVTVTQIQAAAFGAARGAARTAAQR